MDALLAEINRKRKQIDSSDVTANKKFFKRGELAAQQTEEYHKKREENLKRKGLIEEEGECSTSDISKNVKGKEEKYVEKKTKLIPHDELIRRLREKREPIRLFAETHEEACQRLRYVEMMMKDDDRGLQNDFKAALDKIDQNNLDEFLEEQNKTSNIEIRVKEEPTTLPDIIEMANDMGKGDRKKDCQIVLKFLQFVLYTWAKDLNQRPLDIKHSLEGKLKSARYEQTSTYLKPLFRNLKNLTIEDEILRPITEITECMLTRNYVKASDSYLRMAIGNAPWPIGVTMVGIHARTGREKIYSQHVAHVLNDEAQRKYIQGLKRLMTVCQKHFPTTPSMSVEYKGVDV